MNLKELREQVEWLGERFADDAEVIVRRYVDDSPIYTPSSLKANLQTGAVEVTLKLSDEEAKDEVQ